MQHHFKQINLIAILIIVLVLPALTEDAAGILTCKITAGPSDKLQEEKTGSQASREDVFNKYYFPSADEVSVVDVPEMLFAMIDGEGNPNTSSEFTEAVETLYTVSFTLNVLIVKEKLGPTPRMMPLEGLWWTGENDNFDVDNKDTWKWTVMIMQPDFVTGELFARAVDQARKSRKPPAIDKIRLEGFHEGSSAQILHIGPYSEEGPTIEKLHNFIAESGYQRRGKHHEIYFGDPRMMKPEKLKTIIRQPFKE